jgi:iron complex transport system substrate-binding protein
VSASAPLRIVSLVPAGTEIIALLGADEHLVGRSHECDYPPGVRRAPVLSKQKVTQEMDPGAIDQHVRNLLAAGESLYELDEAGLITADPDVIITQNLCGVCSIDLGSVRRATERLNRIPRIISLNPTSLGEVLDDVLRVGEAIGRDQEALRAVVRLRERIDRARECVNPYEARPPVAVLEWTAPLFIAGHWSAELIELAGGVPVLAPKHSNRGYGPSTRISPEDLCGAKPEFLIVCPCGFDIPLARRCANTLSREPWWADLPAVRSGQTAIVDGNAMFNRPGPRLADALEWLVGFLHGRPEIIPPGFPWELMRDEEMQYAPTP